LTGHRASGTAKGAWRALVLLLVSQVPAVAQPALNLILLGDSLTEGVPHLNGETDTYGFMVSQQFPGSTYVKLGYRGQSTDYLREHLDGFLFAVLKADYENVLVLWAGTNDCSSGPLDCARPVYSNLVAMARIAHAAGWKVVAVTMIARGNYFIDAAHQAAFPANQATLNELLRHSSEFDAIADPAPLLADPTDTSLYWDGCHLFPKGYRIVAGLLTQAIRGLP